MKILVEKDGFWDPNTLKTLEFGGPGIIKNMSFMALKFYSPKTLKKGRVLLLVLFNVYYSVVRPNRCGVHIILVESYCFKGLIC